MANPLLTPIMKAPPMSRPERQIPGNFEDHVVRKVVLSKEIVTDDHNADGDKPQVVNVCYGTSNTLDASTVPVGTLFITYTA